MPDILQFQNQKQKGHVTPAKSKSLESKVGFLLRSSREFQTCTFTRTNG
jgi:hypothetical protein